MVSNFRFKTVHFFIFLERILKYINNSNKKRKILESGVK